MPRVIDLECNLPSGIDDPEYREAIQGRPGNPVADRLERPEGYGFDNYNRIFKGRAERAAQVEAEERVRLVDQLVADMDRAGIEVGISGRRLESDARRVAQAHPKRFISLVAMSPLDGMRGVREFERLVRDEGVGGMRVVAALQLHPRQRPALLPALRQMRRARRSGAHLHLDELCQ